MTASVYDGLLDVKKFHEQRRIGDLHKAKQKYQQKINIVQSKQKNLDNYEAGVQERYKEVYIKLLGKGTVDRETLEEYQARVQQIKQEGQSLIRQLSQAQADVKQTMEEVKKAKIAYHKANMVVQKYLILIDDMKELEKREIESKEERELEDIMFKSKANEQE